MPALTVVKRTEDKAAKSAAGTLDLKALMSVKLKKKQPSETQQPLEKVASLVSLEALQGVRLKKVQDENLSSENLLLQQEKQQPQFLLKLKKSGADRSPGGTPYRQAPAESTGDGFTPMLSNALKKKFKQANGVLSPQRTPSPQKQVLTDISGLPLTPIGSPLRGH